MKIFRLTVLEFSRFLVKEGDAVCWQYPASEKNQSHQPGELVERVGRIDKILPTGNLLVVTPDQQYRQYRRERIMSPIVICRE